MIVTDDEGWLFYRDLDNSLRVLTELLLTIPEATQHSKLLTDLPPIDIVIKMGCNVVCPYLPSRHVEDWGLEDPSGKSDTEFMAIIDQIESNVKKLTELIKNDQINLF